MSRRLRFQVKPNLNLTASSTEEGKSTPSIAPSTEIPKTSVHNESVPVEESANLRSPSPVGSTSVAPTPAPVFSSTTEPVAIEPEANISTAVFESDYNEIADVPASIIDQQIGDQGVNEEITTQPDTTVINPNENVAPTSARLPPGFPEKLDWRTMRKELKGQKLDRSTFKMRDLIFWNPAEDEVDDAASTSSGMSSRKRKHEQSIETPPPRPASRKLEKADEARPTAPQVKVNPDGTITLDETSLVVDRREQATEIDFETVDERYGGLRLRGPRLNSMSFKKNYVPRGKKWGTLETDKFYRVLAFVGLDFTLMHELFTTRSRVELKRKYKRESEFNPGRIDDALMSQQKGGGPWKELKEMIITRGRCSGDERGRTLLDSAKELIDEEEMRIMIEEGKRNPTVADATRIARNLSKDGFGSKEYRDDDIPAEKLEQMAEKLIRSMAKRDELEKKRRKKDDEDAEVIGKCPIATRRRSKKKPEPQSSTVDPVTDDYAAPESEGILRIEDAE